MAWRAPVATGRSCFQSGANPQQSPRQVWLLWSPSRLPDLHRTRQSAPHISSAGRLASPAAKPFVLYTVWLQYIGLFIFCLEYFFTLLPLSSTVHNTAGRNLQLVVISHPFSMSLSTLFCLIKTLALFPRYHKSVSPKSTKSTKNQMK